MKELINVVGVITLLLGLYYTTFLTLVAVGGYFYLTSEKRKISNNMTPEEKVSYSINRRYNGKN